MDGDSVIGCLLIMGGVAVAWGLALAGIDYWLVYLKTKRKAKP